MKKLISVLLSVALVAGLFTFFASAKAESKELKFNSDGKFKIMQVTDLQDDFTSNPVAKDFIKGALKQENPDLVVLTGDNIAGYSAKTGKFKKIDTLSVKIAIDQFMSIFEAYGVPVAAVFGNHDDEGTLVTKEEQLEMYQKYDCFIGYDAVPEMYGCGTYNLPIYASDNSEKVNYNLWMFDSNTYDEELGGYDYVHDDQVQWYQDKSNELKEQNGGVCVPSMAFQHIIVKEIFNVIEECSADAQGAYLFGDKYQHIKDENYKAGYFKEWPCPATRDGKQFSSMVEQGDVVAMFFGHDHNNSFEATYKGIDLVATPGFTFLSYGNEDRGFRIINLDENDTSTYETHLIHWADVYGNSKIATNHYNMYASSNTWEQILSGIKYILCFPVKALFGYIF